LEQIDNYLKLDDLIIN